MRLYLYDDWVRIETDYGTWKFSSDEITDIQRTVDSEVDDRDFVEVKINGYREELLLSHEVELYLEEYYFENIEEID